MIASGLKSNSNFTIMLVDDEPHQLRYLKLILKDASYNIIKVENAKTALKILKTTLPDLIISDLVMPEVDGIALCKEIYSNNKYKHIPFVLITAIHDSLYQKQGYDAGAIDYIYKPYTPDILLGKIHKILSRTLEKRHLTILFLSLDPQKILTKKSTFADYDIDISVTDDAEYALEMIHNTKTHMIISEKKLKGKSGYEFCGIIKKGVFNSIPFIIISNNISSDVFLEGTKYGVNDYWENSLSTKELASNIKTFFNHAQPSNSYPKGIVGNLIDSSLLEILQMLNISKKSGILAISTPAINGHLHFNGGQISDAFVSGFNGSEAFYSLTLIDSIDGQFHFISTKNEKTANITETTESLFINAARLKDEIDLMKDEKIILNQTYKVETTEEENKFAQIADGKKTLKKIIHEMEIDLYHGFLVFEKLKNKGCVISPEKEILLMEEING